MLQRLTSSRKLWIALIVLPMIFVIGLTCFFKGWTWAFYDELRWTEQFLDFKSFGAFTRLEWAQDGRFRPFNTGFVWLKLWFFQLDPHLLRIARVAEWAGVIALVYLFLRRQKLSIPVAVVTMLFWLKSPPQLEQIHWWALSELSAVGLIVAALLVWKKSDRRSKALAYAFLVAAVLFKEPMAMFLPIAALFYRDWKHVLGSGAVAVFYLGYHYLHRKGYGATYTAANLVPSTVNEILRGTIIDFALAVPAFFILGYTIHKSDRAYWEKWLTGLYPAVVCFAFGVVYGILILPKAWGYTYILMPSLFFLTLGFGFTAKSFFEANLHRFIPKNPLKIFLLYFLGVSVLFSFRIDWNWVRVYKKMVARNDMIEFIAKQPDRVFVGVNCPIDNKHFNLAAEVKKHGFASLIPPESPACPYATQKLLDCCKNNATHIALGRECSDYDRRYENAVLKKLELVHENKGWALFKCPGSAARTQGR